MDQIAQDQRTDHSGQGALPHRVRHALAYMRGNIAEKVTLAGLAIACATPERTLLKQFRKFVGLSPLAYLLRLRLNAAREGLLKRRRRGDRRRHRDTLRLHPPWALRFYVSIRLRRGSVSHQGARASPEREWRLHAKWRQRYQLRARHWSVV